MGASLSFIRNAAQTKVPVLNVSDFHFLIVDRLRTEPQPTPTHPQLVDLVTRFDRSDKLIIAIGDGVEALVKARAYTGLPLIAGRKITASTLGEQRRIADISGGVDGLEPTLRSLGADYRCGPDFRPFAVRDGNILTGQNLASSKLVAIMTIALAGTGNREPI